MLDVIIIGGGLAGVLAARSLQKKGKSFVMIEKNAQLGGCWAATANRTTSTQSESPSYSFLVDFDDEKPSSSLPSLVDSPYFPQASMIQQANSLLESPEMAARIKLQHRARKIKQLGQDHYCVEYVENSSPSVVLTLSCRRVWVFPGCVTDPQEIVFPGENSFKRPIASGFENKIQYSQLEGQHVAIIGFGAFAMENARTALDNGAKKVTLLGRHDRLIVPRPIAWLTNARSESPSAGQLIDWCNLMYENILHRQVRDSSFYQAADQRYLIDIVPTISDFFFSAQAAGKLEFIRGEVEEITEAGLKLKDSREIPCDSIIKCLGFQGNHSVLELFDEATSIKGFSVNGDRNLFLYWSPERVGGFLPLTASVDSLSAATFLAFGLRAQMILEELEAEEAKEIIKNLPEIVLVRNRPVPYTFQHLDATFGQLCSGASRGPSFMEAIGQILQRKSDLTMAQLPIENFLATCKEEWRKMTAGLSEPPEYPYTVEKLKEYLIEHSQVQH